jgi:hypothetical protein
VAARLCNFPTGLADLLGSHQAWLEENVKPALQSAPAPWVDLIGHASRRWLRPGASDPHELNQQLSLARCESVKSFVSGLAANVTFNIQRGVGDSESVSPNDNAGYDRAVEIYVYGSKPPAKPQPKPVPSVEFEIRVVGGGSASIAAQADDYFFQIVDLVRRQTAFFFYTGIGLGISIPKIPGPGSMTKAGPPTKFSTTRPVMLYQFNSRATLFQDPGATLGPWSVGGTFRLSIDAIIDEYGLVSTRPGIIPMEGGWGIQMPGLGSASEGVLARVTDIWPFSGY